MSIKFYPKSRAAGICKTCGADIKKGSPAWWGQSSGWKCTSCKPADDQGGEKPKSKDAPRAAELPPVRITKFEGRTDIEFDRLHDAAVAAVSWGKGTIKNPEQLDASIKRQERKEFFSRRTAEGLIKVIQEGEDSMTALVERLREEINADLTMPTENRRRIRRGRETGDEMDPDRFLSRIPEMWSRMETERNPKNRVTVLINGSVNCKEKQEHLGYRAAAAIALADRLTEMGVSVEIVMMASMTGNPTSENYRVTSSVVVKHSDQPMSISDLAAGCCMIGAYRLPMIYGTVRYLEGNVEPGIGMPDRIPADKQTGTFMIDRDVTSRRSAVEWVKKSIEQYSNSGAEQ